MQFWIGTSAFQYPEWKGGFYPADMPASRMLGYYAERFSTTEINYSFRRIPSEKSIAGWAAGTSAQFKFSFKAPQKVTHFSKLRDCAQTVQYFNGILAPLGEKLGAVLFQLPPTLKKDAALLRSFVAELPTGMRAAFEFRHASWFDDETFTTLREGNAALCLAENEDLATPAVATADFGYLRLRREDYTRVQLAKWAKFARAQSAWREAFVYFKHEETGVGPKFAATFQKVAEA